MRAAARVRGAWLAFVVRRPMLVVVVALLTAAAALNYARTHLGVNTDTADMISATLPWRQNYIAYTTAFPDAVELVVAVVDAPTTEIAESTSAALVRELSAMRGLVQWAEAPGQGAFFARNGLLFLSNEELAAFSERLNAAQPVLGTLANDPSMQALAGLLIRAAQDPDEANTPMLARVLADMSALAHAIARGERASWSWRRVFGAVPGVPGPVRQIILIRPVLDYGELFPLGPFLEHWRPLAEGVVTQAVASGAGPVQVRLTGAAAMAHEELHSVANGMGRTALGALLLVGLILAVGLRSPALIAASLLTLLVGLSWTAAFAAAAVGQLNLISIAFAVLYIGLGVDYAVHYGLRFRERRLAGDDVSGALATAGTDVGGALALCAVTTGAGFYAFVPTDFAGVAELGLISGTGMFISLAATMTLMPACIVLFTPAANQSAANLPNSAKPLHPGFAVCHARPVCALAAAGAVASFAALPSVRFDENPLNLRNAGGEAVSTYRDLLADTRHSLWTMVAVATGASAAEQAAAALNALPEVSEVRSVESFVPRDQPSKLAVIDELAFNLAFESVSEFSPAAPGQLQQIVANFVSGLRGVAELKRRTSPQNAQWEGLAEALTTLTAAGQPELLAEFERQLLSSLPPELRRLQRALEAEPVKQDGLPEHLLRRWVSTGGVMLVEAFPVADMRERTARNDFVDAVTGAVPTATGAPLVNRASARAVVGAFQQAFATALVVIFVIVLVTLGSFRDSVLVLAPLLLALGITVVVLVLVGQPFNFANVITLPLLLGIGVDNGIHVMSRIRGHADGLAGFARSGTARAVTVSALTTVAGFGNLALSNHPGTASMGLVLSIGMVAMLVCSLMLLPALVAAFGGAGRTGTR